MAGEQLVKTCEAIHGGIDKRLDQHDEFFDDIFKRLDRPTWVVTVIISILTSSSAVMATLLAVR